MERFQRNFEFDPSSIERGSARLLQGDALEILKSLPSESVDVGFTSPPYNKQEKNKGWLVKNVLYDQHQDAMPESEYQADQVSVLNEAFRLTVPGGSFFYNHKLRWEKGEMYHPIDWLRKTSWTLRQEIIWNRTIAANIRGWRFWTVDERIYWLYKPIADHKTGDELLSKDAKLSSVWKGVPERDNPHPAPFPLWLPVRAIVSAMNARGIGKGRVIDPYVGSGTTAVAATLLGHSCTGIDLSGAYLESARERIRLSERERPLVEQELLKHEIKDTFRSRKARGKNVGKFRKGDTDGI